MSIASPQRIKKLQQERKSARPSPTVAPRSAAADRAAGPRAEPEPRTATTRRSQHDPTRLDVTNYNVAGGNREYSQNFREHTSDLVAEQFTGEGKRTDVATLQEVAVDNGNAPGLDYNREIQTDIFAQTFDVPREDVNEYYLDEQGQRHLITEDNRDEALDAQHFVVEGGGHSMTIDLETFDSQGNPQDFVRPGDYANGDRHSITVYRAQLDNGQEYNTIFGDSGAGDKGYGNSVILGPHLSIRDANGTIPPGSLQVQELGSDPELWKPESERERRTALGVNFTDALGRRGTAVSAHLTTERLTDEKAEEYGLSDDEREEYQDQLPDLVRAEQADQVRELRRFAGRLGGGENTIVGADFNHDDPAFTDRWTNAAQHDIDAIWGIFSSSDGTQVVDPADDHHSDHDLVNTEIYL